MCGRFANGLAYDEFRRSVASALPPDSFKGNDDPDDYHPSYNVAPGTRYPIVRAEGTSLVIEAMRWGIPLNKLGSSGQGEPAAGHRVINSRSDTLMNTKSTWHKLLATRRCVVFCQGFYEWQKVRIPGEKDHFRRIPHFVGMHDPGKGRIDANGHERRLMPMAGLWTDIAGEDEHMFTIVTTQSNKQLDFLHDRMPLILPDIEAILLWLGFGKEEPNIEASARLLRPYDGTLDCYPVPPEVGKVGVSRPNLILPVSNRKDGIASMFASVQAKNERASSDIKREPAEADEVPSLEERWKGKSEHDEVLPAKEEHRSPTHTERLPATSTTPKREGKAVHSAVRLSPSPSPKRRKTDSTRPPNTPSLDSFWKTS